MTTDRLNELKELVTNGLYFDDHTQVFTAYREISKQDRDDLLALIEAELYRQSVTDAEVQDVITTLEEYAYQNLDDGFEPCQISTGEVIDVVLPALSAYRKPSAGRNE